MCPWSISEAEAQLDPSLFVRVHRRHIVAIPHVSFVRKEGDGAVIELDGPSPHRVPVSRAKIAEVKARLGLRRGAQGHSGWSARPHDGRPRAGGEVDSHSKCNTSEKASAGVLKSRHLRGVLL